MPKEQIVSPVAQPPGMTRLQQRSPSPCSLDGVPPPPPQPHYISTLRANARRGNSPEKDKDPLTALQRFLRALYRELASRDQPQPPAWAPELPPGTLSPASFQPALRLVAPGESATMRMDQLLTALRMDEGILLEAPRRVLIEGLPGSGKTSLALRLLHSWATHSDPWLSNAIHIALLIPLRELRSSGQSLSQFIGKSLFPRAALGSGKDSFSRVWRRLSALEEKLMIVLDGDYDDELLTGDATELLEGRLLPDARVVITLCPGRRANQLAPFVQRRVLLTGLQLNHVARLTQQYFLGKRIPDGASRFLDALGEESNPLRDLATWPLGWILLCIMFEEGGGTLPSPDAPVHEIYNAMFKCMVSRCLARRGQSPTESGGELPTHAKKLMAEFGKLALSGVNAGCFVYQETEIKTACHGLEITELGFLTRGLQFGRGGRKLEHFHAIHPAFSEYLAAYYVSSIVHYSNILQREMEEIPGFLHPDTPSLIPRVLMGLLGRKGFLVFEQLCPLDVSIRVLFTLLRACGPGDANVAAVCRLLRCTGVGSSGAQVVHTSPGELLGWSLVLSSAACPLQALELIVQTENVDPEALDKFFCALAENESVKAVRISSLLGHELSATQVIKLSKYVALTVPKPRLQTFELVITCVDEIPPDRFQPLVNSLSACLSQGEISCPKLSKLVLDLSLNSSQLSQLCAALEETPSVSVLHLPHLGCGADGLRALAALMRVRPLLALNLSGSWGALVRDDPPSSSGVSVGSSSGSTERAKGSSPKGSSYFSLPRSHTYHSLSRGPASTTLPRAPGTPKDDKRLSDTALFQKYCPPIVCEALEHRTASGFHAIFESAKDPNVCVRALNVSKCALGADDALCLGDAVRKSRSLAALRLEGASRLGEVLPVILALPESPGLQLLDLASPRIVFMDAPTQLLCHALSRSPSLRLLGLDGWTFRVEEDVTLGALTSFLRSTELRDLVLSHCRVHITCVEGRLARLGKRDDYEVRAELLSSLPEFDASSVVFLRLAGFAVAVNEHVVLRGPHILPFLRGFTRLSELDLSLDQHGDPDKEEFVDDKTLVHFISTLSQHFRSLQTLRLGGWRIKLEEPERSLRAVGRALRLCSLSHLRADNLSVTDGGRNAIEHCFLQTAVASLGLLSWLAIEGVGLQPHQAATLGRAIRDRFAGSTLRISAQDVGAEAIKALIGAVQEGAKAEVTYLGGAGCNLRIQRVVKNHKIRGRLRRFTSLKD
ncbi:Hypothetical predicted protein [Cloeon dipterum]|uniref:NACHT domain-containing protein n=1 Tax=Cloeon dipterum TaxID=197152 RepID=A0A8S1C6G5_9INSE|nr:Hypothetical predicted protein [Cloeon dipterum]